jgi:hypothetical protein
VAQDSTVKDIVLLALVGVGGYLLYEWWISSQSTVSNVVTPTPGTTPTQAQTGGITSVSTIPTSTPTTGPGAQGTSAAMPTVQQPTAADLQNALGNAGTATADQWNYEYKALMGAGIDSVFGFNFNTVYGAVGANGQRSSGQMTAQAFLNAPASAGYIPPQTVQGTSNGTSVSSTTSNGTMQPFLPVRRVPASTTSMGTGTIGQRAGLAGLGAITHFYTPVINPLGSMVYRAQHPSPYRYPQTSGSGISGFTQATGFEQALWASGSLYRNRIP